MKLSTDTIPTGFPALDEMTGGLRRGELVCIASRPGRGKTALALNIVANTVLSKDPRPVLFISVEERRLAIMSRLIAAEAKVKLQKIRTGRFPRVRWQDITTAAARFSEAPLFINDVWGTAMNTRKSWHELVDLIERLVHRSASAAEIDAAFAAPRMTVSHIFETSHEAQSLLRQNGKELGLIVIDFVQMLRGASLGETLQQELSKISRDLKGLARDLNIPVIALSQLAWPTGEQGRTDLRELGDLAQDADVLAFILGESDKPLPEKRSEIIVPKATNPKWDDTKIIAPTPPILEWDDAEIIVAKNPRGKTGTVKMKLERDYVKFSSLHGVALASREEHSIS